MWRLRSLWDNGHMRRLGLIGAWLIALVVTTSLTWQIVRAADSQISDRPAPINVAAPVITDLTTSTTVVAPDTTVTTIDRTTTTSNGTTSTSQGVSTTTSTAPATTASTAWKTKSVKTAGGTLVLQYRPGEVAYQAATAAAGFHVEIEKLGPPKVEVKFESESMEIEVHAEWRDGDLDVEVSESAED